MRGTTVSAPPSCSEENVRPPLGAVATTFPQARVGLRAIDEHRIGREARAAPRVGTHRAAAGGDSLASVRLTLRGRLCLSCFGTHLISSGHQRLGSRSLKRSWLRLLARSEPVPASRSCWC